jgi:hypothetical protein
VNLVPKLIFLHLEISSVRLHLCYHLTLFRVSIAQPLDAQSLHLANLEVLVYVVKASQQVSIPLLQEQILRVTTPAQHKQPVNVSLPRFEQCVAPGCLGL